MKVMKPIETMSRSSVRTALLKSLEGLRIAQEIVDGIDTIVVHQIQWSDSHITAISCRQIAIDLRDQKRDLVYNLQDRRKVIGNYHKKKMIKS